MSHWDVIYRTAWIVLGVLFAVGLICMIWPQFRQYQEDQRRVATLEAEIRMDEEIGKHLDRQRERIEQDPRFAERVAHELGLVKTNETIFKFVDEAPAPAPALPPSPP